MSKTLSGRIALVTGASRGIGRSSAIALGAAGAHVICIARTVGGLEETDDAIQKAGGTATLVPLNLKDFAAMDRLGASIFDRWGKLDAFLGNAAILGALTPLAQLDPKLFGELALARGDGRYARQGRLTVELLQRDSCGDWRIDSDSDHARDGADCTARIAGK